MNRSSIGFLDNPRKSPDSSSTAAINDKDFVPFVDDDFKNGGLSFSWIEQFKKNHGIGQDPISRIDSIIAKTPVKEMGKRSK